MRRLKKILLWIIGVVLLVFITLGVLIFVSMQPTTGPRIASYKTPRTAVLIIDIQEDYTGPQAKKRYRDGDRIVAASNALLAQAQSKGAVVVYIENVFDGPITILTGGINAAGSPGVEMDRRLTRIPGARTFTKNRSDAFSSQELDAFLRESQVDHVILMGLDGAYCVNATARGALNRGYKVTLFPQGIATESSKSLDELARGWREAGAEVKPGTEM